MKCDWIIDNATLRHEQLKIVGKHRIRREAGDLKKLAASLDEVGQTQPLTVVAQPGSGYAIVDGARRYMAVAGGLATHFDPNWRVQILQRRDGKLPTDENIWKFCAHTNSIRLNWSPIEEAHYYDKEIKRCLSIRVRELNIENSRVGRRLVDRLSKSEERRVRSQAIRKLAESDKTSASTIRSRLQLLALPDFLQKQVALCNISAEAAIYLSKLEGNRELFQAAASLCDVDLSGSLLPSDCSSNTVRIGKNHILIAAERTGYELGTVKNHKLRGLREIRKLVQRLDNEDSDKPTNEVLRTLRWVLNETDTPPL